jgi:hypothetical protein
LAFSAVKAVVDAAYFAAASNRALAASQSMIFIQAST